MNADFEMELACMSRPYHRPGYFDEINRRLSKYLLLLARPGDALLLEKPWGKSLTDEADRRDVLLLSPTEAPNNTNWLFTPWGWTASALAKAKSIGAAVP